MRVHVISKTRRWPHRFWLVWVTLLFSSATGLASTKPATHWNEVGKASFYASSMKNARTASGVLYQPQLKTAAHRSLPFGTRLKVTHLKNGKSVVVVVNDRGPFVKGRVIDLSQSAFRSLAQLSEGVIGVKVEVMTGSPSMNVKKESHENTKK